MTDTRAGCIMKIDTCVVIFFLSALCHLVPNSVEGEKMYRNYDEDGENRQFLKKVLDALERTVGFFAEDIAAINVDGFLGIRECQGSIQGTLTACSDQNFHCPRSLVHHLDSLARKLSHIADRAVPYVEDDDPQYFTTFKGMLDKPFLLDIQYTPRSLGRFTRPVEVGYDSNYSEDEGDKCIAALLGTLKEDESSRNVPQCTVSNKCFDYMTRDGTSQYYLTHQLQYFIIAENMGCQAQLAEHLRKKHFSSVREFDRHLCRKIFLEAEGEEKDGEVAIMKQDLFLEQSLLCGMLGFSEFMSYPWMQMVLGWQKYSGCFGMTESLAFLVAEISSLQSGLRRYKKLLVDLADEHDKTGQIWKTRKLLREKAMAGGCLSHKTGLGLSTLGVYLRYLVHHLYRDRS